MRIQRSGAFERRAAERIAQLIEFDIIGRELPAGTMIGSESELMERYAASRGVIREAVTLLESHMMAETRRGVGGGLVVAEPAPRVVEDIVALYLARKKASGWELLEARLPLEILAMRQTMEHLDEAGVELLEAEMGRMLSPDENLTKAAQRFHNLIAQLSGNTVLQLFIPTMTTLVEDMWDLPRVTLTKRQRLGTWAHVTSAHNEIIAAMLAKDVDGSVALLRQHLEQVSSSLGPEQRSFQLRPIGHVRT